jgi:hypothetical protein
MLTIKTKGRPVPKTFQATQARRRHYDQVIRNAVPFIKQARLELFTRAEDFAWFLNLEHVSSPTGKPWTPPAVLRMLSEAKRRGLDCGSYAPNKARGVGYYDGSTELRAAALARRGLYKQGIALATKDDASGCTLNPTKNDALSCTRGPTKNDASGCMQVSEIVIFADLNKPSATTVKTPTT